jgi:hypothetical protein
MHRGKKMAPRCPNPYIEPSVAVVTYGLALVAISLNAPVRIAPSHRARAYPHLLEMPPYALLLHSVPAHTPNGIPERNLGAPLLEARAPLDLVRACPECASE